MAAYQRRFVEQQLEKNPIRHRIKKMVSSARSYAKCNSIPFDLTLAWMLENYSDLVTCPALGVPLNWASKGGHCPESPSLDRIVPRLGYIKGNVQVISYRANRMKNDASLAELRTFIAWVASLTADPVLAGPIRD